VAGLVAAGLSAVMASAALAFNPQPEPPALFSAVGITRGQTGRLYVVNHVETTRGPTTGPCMVELMFHDETGSPIKSGMVTLGPGQAGFLEVTGEEVLGTSAAARGAIGPCVMPSDGCGAVVPTLEIYDTETGRTEAILNPLVWKGFNPQPEPPATR
jgi:hypothetical protein